MPVPPGTAWHQLYSVPPTGLPLGSTLWEREILSCNSDSISISTQEPKTWCYQFPSLSSFDCRLSISLLLGFILGQKEP
nr:hypothetical protein CFP56_29201 [Quercus suber]